MDKAKRIDLSKPEYAEAVFWFCNDPEQLDDNDLKRLIYDDISMAEFVQKYKKKQFELWYSVKYGTEA